MNSDNKTDDLKFPPLPTEPVAYVRPVAGDAKGGYAVCAADGTELAVFASRDAAFYAAELHDLSPTLVH